MWNIDVALETLRAALNAQARSGSVAPFVVDMHYGVCHGTPFIEGESGGTVCYTLAAPAAAGSRSISLVGPVSPVEGQLIVLDDHNGHFQTAVASAVDAGPTVAVTLAAPLTTDVPSGPRAWNWYANPGHPNTYGMYSAIDGAMRNKNMCGFTRENVVQPTAPGRAVMTQNPGADVLKGHLSAGSPSWHAIYSPGAAEAITRFDFGVKETGWYRTRFALNTCGKNVLLYGYTNDPAAPKLKEFFAETINHSAPCLIERDIRVQAEFAHDLHIAVISSTDTGGAVNHSDLDVLRHNDSVLSYDWLNSVRHVVLTDSWGTPTVPGLLPGADGSAQPAFDERLRWWLPGADIVNAAHGGDTANAILSRVATQVLTLKPLPAVAHIMVGTNNWNNLISITEFIEDVLTMVYVLQAHGIVPIIYTTSVASPFGGNEAKLALSRLMAHRTPYHRQVVRPS